MAIKNIFEEPGQKPKSPIFIQNTTFLLFTLKITLMLNKKYKLSKFRKLHGNLVWETLKLI